MWVTVLVFALIAATEPVRIGITAFLISCPRPMLNLLAYWVGLMATSVGAALVALFWLRDFMVPVMRVVTSAATNPIVPPILIILGVLALTTAARLAVRSSVRQPVTAPVPGSDPSALVLQPKTPTIFSRLSWPGLLERRSVGMAFVAGLFTSTQIIEYWGAILVILASGAAVGAQVSAAVMFTLVSFAIVEIPLVSYLASPAKTQAVVEQLHDWIRARRRLVFASILGAVGVLMVANGMGGF
jgi:hypothetical protein